jgi:hypothetical protein
MNAVYDPSVVAALVAAPKNDHRFRSGDKDVLSAVEGPRGYLRRTALTHERYCDR